MKRRYFFPLRGAALCLAFLLPVGAGAQTVVAESQPADTLLHVGYARGTLNNLSGSVELITEKQMNRELLSNPLEAIQGRVAGLTIQKNGNGTAALESVRLRGTTSLTSGNEPLIVVDGVPGDLSMLTSLYPTDIESFTKTVLPSTAPNVCMLTMGDSISKMSNGSTGIFTIYPYDSEALYGTGHPFLITKRGDNYYLRFRDAVAGPDETEEQEFVYDAERDLFTGVEHPEYIIEGDLPYSFFATSMSESGRTWNLTSSAEMSDDLRERYDGLSSAMSAQGARFNQLSFSYSHDSYVCTLTGRLGNAQLNYNFKFTLTPIDNGYTMHYEGPADDNSTDILESFPEMLDLLNVFNADFTVEATSSRFNMRQLRLSSASGTNFMLTIN